MLFRLLLCWFGFHPEHRVFPVLDLDDEDYGDEDLDPEDEGEWDEECEAARRELNGDYDDYGDEGDW